VPMVGGHKLPQLVVIAAGHAAYPRPRMTWELRPPRRADVAAIVRLNLEGFEGYRSFAPRGWEPPPPEDQVDWLGGRLFDPEVWCLLAEDEHGAAGHVAFMPAALVRRASNEAGLAQLWLLFVRTSRWGSGLASELHARALEEAARRGFSAMRLFTPTGQARARRFYEREGWKLAGEPFDDAEFGLELVEYRRAL
jgi:GNAT superfamily N-acetyltransferase